MPAGITAATGASPAVLGALPDAVRIGFISGYADALHTVFLWAAPVGLLAFALSFLLKELPLRDTTRAPDRAQTTAPTAVPATRDSAQEMERALLTLFGRERRAEVYQGLAETAGVPVSPRACWLLYRVADTAPIQADALATVLGITRAELDARLASSCPAGMFCSPTTATGRRRGARDPDAGRAAGRGPAGGSQGGRHRPADDRLGAGPSSRAAPAARPRHQEPGGHRPRARAGPGRRGGLTCGWTASSGR
jgi:NADH:ubiquinone oxidoreductase subunit